MKKTVYFCLIYMLSIMYAFPQNGDQEEDPPDGFEFVKRVDFNHPDNKNVLVDFYYLPLYDGDENTKQFKIVRDSSTNVYILEINYNVYNTDDAKERCSCTISDQLAEKIHKKMTSLFVNFKAKKPDRYTWISLDGYKVTFRTVVEDELWYLEIRNPTGNARKLHELCYQILEDAYSYKDAEGKKLDEASYIKIFDSFDFERSKPND